MTEQLIQRTLDETTNFEHRQNLLKELWRLHQQRAAEPEVSASAARSKPIRRVNKIDRTAAQKVMKSGRAKSA